MFNARCCVRNCKAVDKKRHYFPSPHTAKDRYQQWLEACDNREMFEKTTLSNRHKRRICNNHFESKYILSNGRLSKYSIPTINLPEPLVGADPYAADTQLTNIDLQSTLPSSENLLTYNFPIEEEIPDMPKNSVTDIVIREAVREDMHQVCQLIKDLAEFEKLQNQVKINPEMLMKDGFDTDAPAFKCFVAELDNGQLIGYALYYTCYSTWLGKSVFLEDLYVDPAYRKGGVGKELILSVAKIAYETSQRLDFHVLSWNPAIEFYKSLGAINLTSREEWQLFRLDENSLNKLFNS